MSNLEQATNEVVACWEGLVPFILGQPTPKHLRAELERRAPDIAQQAATEALLRLHKGQPIPDIHAHMHAHTLSTIERTLERCAHESSRRLLQREFERRVSANNSNALMAAVVKNAIENVNAMGERYVDVFLKYFSQEESLEKIAEDLKIPVEDVEKDIDVIQRRLASLFLQRPMADTKDPNYRTRRDYWNDLGAPPSRLM